MLPEELLQLEMGELIIVTYHPKNKFYQRHFQKNLILNIVIGYYSALENADLPWESLWLYQPWYKYEDAPRLEQFEAENISNILPIHLHELPGVFSLLHDATQIEEWYTMFKVEALLTHRNRVLREFAQKQINNGPVYNEKRAEFGGSDLSRNK